MRRVFLLSFFAVMVVSSPTLAQEKKPKNGAKADLPAWLAPYQPVADRILATAQDRGSNFAWDRLAFFTDTFGPRLSGSENLEATLRWAEVEMKKDGLENVRLEPVMVPQWIRGDESLELATRQFESNSNGHICSQESHGQDDHCGADEPHPPTRLRR